jgi:hypothetical protein
MVLVKMLPHALPSAEPERRPSTSKNSGRSDLQEARKQHEKIKEDWARLCGELLLATCRRLEMASRVQGSAGKPPRGAKAEGPPGARLPFALHESARVVGRYRAVWPDDVQSRVAGIGLDPLEINYVRIEETSRYRKLLAYYRRRMDPAEESADSQGVWLATLRDRLGTGCKISVDVLVQKANPDDTYEKLDQDEKLSVEILTIEIRAPVSDGADRRGASSGG